MSSDGVNERAFTELLQPQEEKNKEQHQGVCMAVSNYSSDMAHQSSNKMGNCVHITTMLISTLAVCIKHLGCGDNRDNDDVFLNHTAMRHRRLSTVIRDMGYVVENPVGACRVLAGLRDPGAVSDTPTPSLSLYLFYTLISYKNLYTFHLFYNLLL
jgi:hypothetical protein